MKERVTQKAPVTKLRALVLALAVVALLVPINAGPAAADDDFGAPSDWGEADQNLRDGGSSTKEYWDEWNGYYWKSTYDSSGQLIKYEKCTSKSSDSCETVWETSTRR